MTSYPVHGKSQKDESCQGINSSFSVNDEESSLSDPKETSVLEILNSMVDTITLENTAQICSCPKDSISSSPEKATTLPESTKTSKPGGRLQRWKYRFLGQPKVHTSEKNRYVDGCPINPTDNENQVLASFLVPTLLENNGDTDFDLCETEESSSKVISQNCSVVCSSGQEEVGKSSMRSVCIEQSRKDVKDKTDSLKSSLNKQDYQDWDCRICHGGTSGGELVSPCYCSGTMGQMHVACLEQWLGSNGRKDCELCGYRYHLCREPRSFQEFLKNPGAPNLARHLKCDLFCFAVLTPTTVISVSLLLFAANLLRWEMTWSLVGLISTAIFLVIIYIFWSIMAFTYQRKIWLKWKQANQVVRLKCTSKCHSVNQATTVSESSVSEARSHLRPSTLSLTSTEDQLDIETHLLEMDYNDSESSVSHYIPVDPYRLSQSFSDIRAALPSSSSSACTFSSEPSLLMNTEFSESSSNTRLPKTKLWNVNERIRLNQSIINPMN